VVVAAAVLLLTGCGTPPPDLFLIERSGDDPNANLELVVSDGGTVTCNGEEHKLDSDSLLKARWLLRDIEPQAELGIDLPPGRGSTLTYRATMEKGSVEFSDRSEGLPQTFLELAALTKDIAERVCGIER
jgi:hypothetical protein